MPVNTDVIENINLPNTSIDIGKALKLRLQNGLSYQLIADTLKVHKTTIVRTLKPFLKLIKNPEALQTYKDNRAEVLSAAEMTFLSSSLHPDKLKKASSRDLMVNYGIAFDKRRLEEDKSTANLSVSKQIHSLVEDHARDSAELAELLNNEREG